MQASSLRFAWAVEALTQTTRRHGLIAPDFRSPPRLAGAHRSIRWRRGGGATIAVVVRGRPWPAVLADMVDGVLAANRLDGARADRTRAMLWAALDEGDVAAA